MSYILDALRKSETERRQGQIPDLGQQVQLIHRPRKKPVSPIVWITVALLVNAAVLAVIFWPDMFPRDLIETSSPSEPVPAIPKVTPSAVTAETAGNTEAAAVSEDAFTANGTNTRDVLVKQPPEPEQALAESGLNVDVLPQRERPTIIVPSSSPASDNPALPEPELTGRVPHLVELPLSFQKSVPDLTFNSHIYSSDPAARRVMINNNYLRRGDSFSGLVVDNITEDGVVLSKQGQRFRVGIVRDWVSPR